MGRLLAEEGALEACYHCVTRVVDRRFAFGEVEKERFVQILRAYEEFCGVHVLTFCVMSNHVHVLVHVPRPPKQMPDDAELIRLVRRADLSFPAAELEQQLARLRAANDHPTAERLRALFFRRMWNLASFMQAVKQRFSQWFNTRHQRTGTLWEGRFKSVLIEGTGTTLSTLAAYIDLNPVRAGIVQDPAHYRWSGYAQAQAGDPRAQQGLTKVVQGVLTHTTAQSSPHAQRRHLLARYRVYLFENGEATVAQPGAEHPKGFSNSNAGRVRKGIDPKAVAAVVQSGGKLSFFESLRCRVRYFTEGCVIGARAFVERLFVIHRNRFGRRRLNAAREMHGVNFKDLYVIRARRLHTTLAREQLLTHSSTLQTN